LHIYKIGNASLIIKKGDLLQEDVEAIVNPANSYLIMGGGVAGLIKRKGGSIIEEEATKRAPIEIGEAVITSGGRLKQQYVIHSPTMKYPAERTNERNVRLSVRAALREGKKHGIKSIAFPGMGTGVGGLKYDIASTAMIEEIKKFLEEEDHYDKIVIVAYEDEFYYQLERKAEFIL